MSAKQGVGSYACLADDEFRFVAFDSMMQQCGSGAYGSESQVVAIDLRMRGESPFALLVDLRIAFNVAAGRFVAPTIRKLRLSGRPDQR